MDASLSATQYPITIIRYPFPDNDAHYSIFGCKITKKFANVQIKSNILPNTAIFGLFFFTFGRINSIFKKLSYCLFLRLLSLVPSLSFLCQRPRTNQGWTKVLPKNSQTEKVRFVKIVTFIKIAISFPSLIPCLIPPRDNREKSNRTL